MKREIFDKETGRSRKEGIDWFSIIVSAGVLGIILFTLLNFVVLLGSVPTSSMEPAIPVGTYCVLNRNAYTWELPKRGDIVAFRLPDCREMEYIKRIVGLPGESVEIVNGYVFVDGQELDEPYVVYRDTVSFGPFEVPEGHYFMLGDNRPDSNDSRKWLHPYVPAEDIMGKYMFAYLYTGDLPEAKDNEL